MRSKLPNGLAARCAMLAQRDFYGYDTGANIIPTGITSKSKKKKNKKKSGSQGANNVEENTGSKGKHDEAEVNHEEDADEDEHTV